MKHIVIFAMGLVMIAETENINVVRISHERARRRKAMSEDTKLIKEAFKRLPEGLEVMSLCRNCWTIWDGCLLKCEQCGTECEQFVEMRDCEEALRKQAKEIFKKKVSIYICHICGKFLGKNAWCSKCDASSGTEVFEGIPAKVLKKEMGVL